MFKFLSFVLLVIVFLSVLSCRENEPHRSGTIEVSLSGTEKTDSKKVFKNVYFIQLDEGENNQALLSSVSKVAVVGEFLYLLDGGRNSVYVYTLKGEFVKEIENKGEGPTTINLISDFNFNKFTGKIELLSPKGKIVSYDDEKDEFSDEIFVGDMILPTRSFYIVDENNILFYTSNGDNYLVSVDRVSRKIQEEFVDNLNNDAIALHHYSPFLETKEGLLFYDTYRHEVHDISEGVYKGLVHSFDFEENNLDQGPELFGRIIAAGDLLNFINSNNYLYPVGHFFEDEEYIFLQGILGGEKVVILLFDKQRKTWKYSDVTSMGTFSVLRTKIGNRYVGVIKSPENLDRLFEHKSSSEGRGVRERDIRPDGNPVLVFYEFN